MFPLSVLMLCLINISRFSNAEINYNQEVAPNTSSEDKLGMMLSGMKSYANLAKALSISDDEIAFTHKYVELGVFVGYELYQTLIQSKVVEKIYEDYVKHRDAKIRNSKVRDAKHRESKHSVFKRKRKAFNPEQHALEKIKFIMTLFLSQIQSIYKDPTLKGTVTIIPNYLEIHARQSVFDTFGGDRDKLLNSFCEYQSSVNSARLHHKILSSKALRRQNNVQSMRRKFDMALYVSSLNYYSIRSDGSHDGVTMGLSPVGGVCYKSNNCVISEFGATNKLRHPYPSAGLMGSWVAAHEMAHNFGLFHDGPLVSKMAPILDFSSNKLIKSAHAQKDFNERNAKNSSDAICPANGYLMSSSRGTKGEVNWSICSAKLLSVIDAECLSNPNLDANFGGAKNDGDAIFGNEIGVDDKISFENGLIEELKLFQTLFGVPGRFLDAHDQCKLFLNDEDAYFYKNMSNIADICHVTITCKTPNLIGYFTAGPALEGTFCGDGATCVHGICKKDASITPPIEGGWSEWERDGKVATPFDRCESSCLMNSSGISTYRRYCDHPKPSNSENYCKGNAIKVEICDDSAICRDAELSVSRKSIQSYANESCSRFRKLVPEVAPLGVQVPHHFDYPWRACAIFCKLKDMSAFYTPRYELNHFYNDDFYAPYFPDGTLCHFDSVSNVSYYCQNHKCLPPPPHRHSYPFIDAAQDQMYHVDNYNLSNANDVNFMKKYFTIKMDSLKMN